MGRLSLKGMSEVNVHPEITVLTIVIKGMTNDYQKSMKENTDRAKGIKNIIVKNGIRKDDVKSLDFWVKEDYTSTWDKEKGKYKTKFNGYKYNQRLHVKFPNDNAVLSQIVHETSTLDCPPAIDVSFITERSKEYGAQLLKEAMQDAICKAETLAEAGGFELKSIESVYLDDDPLYDREYVCCDAACPDECDSLDLDLEPEDYVLKREVKVDWEIG